MNTGSIFVIGSQLSKVDRRTSNIGILFSQQITVIWDNSQCTVDYFKSRSIAAGIINVICLCNDDLLIRLLAVSKCHLHFSVTTNNINLVIDEIDRTHIITVHSRSLCLHQSSSFNKLKIRARRIRGFFQSICRTTIIACADQTIGLCNNNTSVLGQSIVIDRIQFCIDRYVIHTCSDKAQNAFIIAC